MIIDDLGMEHAHVLSLITKPYNSNINEYNFKVE